MTPDAGEALCYLATKSVPVVPLMECIMLDLHKAQLPEHKDWFKETREARFGPLDKASSHHMLLAAVLGRHSGTHLLRCTIRQCMQGPPLSLLPQ